jgi:hypothetical protein
MNNVLHRVLTIGFLLGLALMTFGQAEEKACFSVPGGFYEASPVLELYPYYQQHHIRFTTNGNRPTAQSRLYTEPLLLDASLYSTSDIYTIRISPDDLYVPDSVQHCIVIRAAVFDENDSCISEVSTNSYFIASLNCNTHGLPAISLCADSLDLFDYYTGILVTGVHFDSLDPINTGNYYQTGIEWERPMNFEFYELDNAGINQRGGLRTHGKSTCRLQQKSLKIYAKEIYGEKRFEYRFFEQDSIDSFKHLILKPFSSSWLQSGVPNHVSQQIARTVNVESLESRPAVMYLNGEYWGIYYVQERPDERYLEDHCGIDLDDVNLMFVWGPITEYGTGQYFRQFYNWLENADLSDSTNWAYVNEHVDMACFIDYQILEMFLGNLDWPANNVRSWQVDDGPLRWIFYDGDGCLSLEDFDVFENALYVGPSMWPTSTRSTLFFRKFLENYKFYNAFKSRFYELLQTDFQESITLGYLFDIRSQIEDEVPLQSYRFNEPTSVDYWRWEMYLHEKFLRNRVEAMEECLEGFVKTKENVIDSFAVYPNPAHNVLFVETRFIASLPATYRITNLMGQTLLQGSITADGQQINVESLPVGMYFITIGDATRKFVVR